MFRLRMHQIPQADETILCCEVKAKNGMSRVISVASNNKMYRQKEMSCRLNKASREIIRDCLLQKYGKNWRPVEIKHRATIDKSIYSAMKRIR